MKAVLSAIDDFAIDRLVQPIMDFALDGFGIDRYAVVYVAWAIAMITCFGGTCVAGFTPINVFFLSINMLALVYAETVIRRYRRRDGGKAPGVMPAARQEMKNARVFGLGMLPFVVVLILPQTYLLQAFSMVTNLAVMVLLWGLACRENLPNNVALTGA